jgi:hypothetical protein
LLADTDITDKTEHLYTLIDIGSTPQHISIKENMKIFFSRKFFDYGFPGVSFYILASVFERTELLRKSIKGNNISPIRAL